MPPADANLDLAAARGALLAERRRLKAELGEPIDNPEPMTYGSQAAAASQVFEQQRDLALRERSKNDLGRVEAALLALDAGTYGTCTSCGKQIARERLEAIPWVPTCIDCARKTGR